MTDMRSSTPKKLFLLNHNNETTCHIKFNIDLDLDYTLNTSRNATLSIENVQATNTIQPYPVTTRKVFQGGDGYAYF